MMPPQGLVPTNEDVDPRLDKKLKIVLQTNKYVRPTVPRATTPLHHFLEDDSLSQSTEDIIQPYVLAEATTSAPNFGPSSSSYTVSSQGDIPRHTKPDRSTSDISEDSRQGRQFASSLPRASSAP
ncbi:MAG TPA: hypothetical protein VGO47_10515, partial [Chlamydiales bacterium]|nr:hypothetical protein [Chlamydiales bacterium]